VEKEKQYQYKQNGKTFLAPCGNCVYLVDGLICPFVRCVKLNGWKVNRVDKKE
jgi:hypothetical protein